MSCRTPYSKFCCSSPCMRTNVSQNTFDQTGNAEYDLIELVNDLQDKISASGQSLEISLPQIVVVGCQSAGKSSVLENIVGKEFLPRGSGVVTRRPTIVQLQPSEEEYAVFLHKPDEKFVNFDEIKSEIELETEREVGKTGFSNIPISLKIFSPNVLKLTLVDLPGLIKNVVGDQSENAVSNIHDMVKSYIGQPNSLILAISPANQDIANSDALNIAKTVDPNRERTIGVMTKLDIMDEGTNARDILENKVLQLKRGYVGIVNRSQKDIEDARDMKYILEKERLFFSEKPCYSHLAHRMGTPYLQKLLHKQLRAHIQDSIPAVRNELAEKLTNLNKELMVLNEKLCGNGKASKQIYMIRLTQQFIESFQMKLLGQSELIDIRSIEAGAQINFTLYTEVQQYLNLNMKPDKKELTVAIANILAVRTGIAVPSLALDAICRNLLSNYKVPLEKSISSICKVLMNAAEGSANEVNHYPSLKNELLYRMNSCIKQQEENTKEHLMNHIEAEMFFVNVGHPDFESSVLNDEVSVTGQVKLWDIGDPTLNADGDHASDILEKLLANEATQKKVEYVSSVITKYLDIVRKSMGDIAIKYIMFFLVKQVLEFVKLDLTASLVASGNIESLMRECEDDIHRKDELEKTCSIIQNTLDTIQMF